MKFPILTLLSLSFFSGSSHGQVDPQATPETRKLYQNLKASAQQGIIFGAQTTTSMGKGWISDSGSPLRSDVQLATGDFPGVFGFDFKKWHFNLDNGWLTDLEQVKAIFKKGGIITFSWHAENPVTGGNCKDTAGDPLPEILPGGSKHALYKSWLDEIARFAHAAEVDGVKVPILFRPFHENSGKWFWWGSQNPPETYIEAFRFTVDYLRHEKGVHNFLYVYSPSRPQSVEHFLLTYPGDDYVDVLGYDHYLNGDEDLASVQHAIQQCTGIITQLAKDKDKIAATTETGCRKGIQNATSQNWFTESWLEPLRSFEGQVAFLMTWHNKNEEAYWIPLKGDPNYDDFINYYKDPSTLFLNDLPDLYR